MLVWGPLGRRKFFFKLRDSSILGVILREYFFKLRESLNLDGCLGSLHNAMLHNAMLHNAMLHNAMLHIAMLHIARFLSNLTNPMPGWLAAWLAVRDL